MGALSMATRSVLGECSRVVLRGYYKEAFLGYIAGGLRYNLVSYSTTSDQPSGNVSAFRPQIRRPTMD